MRQTIKCSKYRWAVNSSILAKQNKLETSRRWASPTTSKGVVVTSKLCVLLGMEPRFPSQ
jgi:hypothetical protein